MIITGDMVNGLPETWAALNMAFWFVVINVWHAARDAGKYVPHHEVQLNMETKARQ